MAEVPLEPVGEVTFMGHLYRLDAIYGAPSDPGRRAVYVLADPTP